jgi:CBS domain-containing protein
MVLNPDFHFEQAGHFWEKLMVWNLLMVAFNLIPAFPMDGGRVLRALLGFVMPFEKATRWAATLGQGIAITAGLWMLLTGHLSPVLLLIAFFVFIAAGQEAAMVTQRQAFAGLLARDAMMTDFRAVPPDATLRDVVELLLSGSQHDFPMIAPGGGLMGLITRQRLISALSEHGPQHPARLILDPCEGGVPPLMDLGEALARLDASTCPAMPVLDPHTGSIIGLLTAENIGELLMVRSALRPL